MRVELFGDEVERITEIDPLTGERLERLDELAIFPATHYVTPSERMARPSTDRGRAAGAARELRGEGKLLEAQRLRMRTRTTSR